MGIANGIENRLIMQDLYVFLAEQFRIRTFVETGTFQGQTARFASRHFDRVITIEAAESIFRSTRESLIEFPNVTCLHGDSGQLMREIVAQLTGPTLFWLDAHWSGADTFGQQSECPLIEELKEIYDRDCDAFTLIDDARFFTSIPPAPHDYRTWPTYFELADFVRQRSPDAFITVHADTIVIVPQHAKERLIAYLRQPLAASRQLRSKKPWFSWLGSRRKAG